MNIIKTYVDAKKESVVVGTYKNNSLLGGLSSGGYIIGQKRISGGPFKEIRVQQIFDQLYIPPFLYVSAKQTKVGILWTTAQYVDQLP